MQHPGNKPGPVKFGPHGPLHHGMGLFYKIFVRDLRENLRKNLRENLRENLEELRIEARFTLEQAS